MRLALLTNIVPPYRVPVFRALADTPGWTLRVLTNAEREFDRDWEVDTAGLDVELVRSLARVSGGGTRFVPLGLAGALRRFAPDVVLSTELGARTSLALCWCALHRVPLVVWSYTTQVRAAEAGWLRERLARFLLARADAVVGMGREARRVLRARGVPDALIVDAPNAHDRSGFEKRLAGLDREAVARGLRAGLGARAKIALVAGRLFPVKGVLPLLEAWARVPAATRADWTLLFVGSGPLAGAVARARERHAPGEIVQVPSLQPDALVDLYAGADLLVFPSLGDVWGLAVNEAMHCGLPVVCSSRAGCAADLVVPGENGWLADPADPAAFAAVLSAALASDRLVAMGARARAAVARYTPEALAACLRRAVERAASA
jgi:glycosyltransferase involved in cell wall biosynthesis